MAITAIQFYDRLSNDLTQLLESGDNYDVPIEVGEEDANIYKVHSIILQSRSPYFKKRFDEITFYDDHFKVLKLPNISVKVFDVIIKYIYGGKIRKFVGHLQTHLINNCASWLRLKFSQIYRKSHKVKNLEIMQDFCNNIIAKHPDTIFESENFHSLPEDALISILKRDDLQLEEGKIWEYIIQWGKAKSPLLPSDLNEWTSDNFLTLKETLEQCLPHIRYLSISGEDVMEKIYPYQQLLEQKLFLDINTKFIKPTKPISSIVLPARNILNTLSTRITSICLSSDIITNEQALEISSWIDKKEPPYIENYLYEFELLVRGSRDGFDVRTIYDICDKVSKTIIILKLEGTGEILGGYNPLEWDNDQNQRKQTEDSFVFSLKTANMKNYILSRVVKFDRAIYNYPRTPTLRFGNVLLEDYEVFKILPRNDLKSYLYTLFHFFPLLLTTAHRQQEDESFYQMLEEIRMGNFTENIITKIQQKVCEYNFTDNVLDTTHIVEYRNTASTINDIIGNYLPSVDEHTDPYESIAIDCMGKVQKSPLETDKLFRNYTNFPTKIILKEGLTLPHVTVSLDETIFADGQAYVALSRATSWNKLEITPFNRDSIKTNPNVIADERLKEKYNNSIGEFNAFII
ncbi:hypothetical protein Glove_185g32 [Diversispora epigaea]|uniref:BTB domain-containing protein n=1 Tax=Diversispora epigaea TaxID=1348612 RepID=A0A397IW59_9GLOM|nr:hypothetical protein Glove_185g32 [Diversispora epigaea]